MDMQPDCMRGEGWANAAEEAAPLVSAEWPASSRLEGRLLLPSPLPAGLAASLGDNTLPSDFRALVLLPQLHHLALLGLFAVASESLSPFTGRLLDSARVLPVGRLLSGSEARAWPGLASKPLSDLTGAVMEGSGWSWAGLSFLLLKKLRRLPFGWSSSVN